MLQESEIVAVASNAWKANEKERRRLDGIADALKPDLSARSINIPKDAMPEMLDFAAKSRTNYLPLVVDVLAQSLRVVGYRSGQSADNLAVWKIWQANGMDARQAGIIRSALEYGYSYATVLPGDIAPVIRGKSPRRMMAMYEDIDDLWPAFAVEQVSKDRMRVIDDAQRVEIVYVNGEWVVMSHEAHNAGVCPVVQFTDRIDLDDDKPRGVVESLIPIQRRIDETIFGLLTAQHFGAFHQRWATGWTVPVDPVSKQPIPFKSSAKNLWSFADPDVKVGQFAAADLRGYLDSKQSGVRDLAAISQVPPQSLLGEMSNLSADALAAAQDGKDRRAGEIEVAMGESFEQTLRLCAAVAGDPESAGDESAQVRWEDTTARSLAQTVDALGKMAQMLGIPPEGLWDRIPDATDQDIANWQALQAQNDTLGQLVDTFAAQAAGGSGGING